MVVCEVGLIKAMGVSIIVVLIIHEENHMIGSGHFHFLHFLTLICVCVSLV